MWRPDSMHLSNSWVKEEIKGEARNCLENNKNKDELPDPMHHSKNNVKKKVYYYTDFDQ